MNFFAKLITSVNESSSFPTLDVPLISLAIRPSSVSIIAAKTKAIIAIEKLLSIANFIELKPKQTPNIVNVFGNKHLGDRLDTILNSLFFYSKYTINAPWEIN